MAAGKIFAELCSAAKKQILKSKETNTAQYLCNARFFFCCTNIFEASYRLFVPNYCVTIENAL